MTGEFREFESEVDDNNEDVEDNEVLVEIRRFSRW
jgi:hypothetical protein